MKNNFDPNLPIYLQVMDEIKRNIFNKMYQMGDKIPSVRELALMYGVNPNTIQKALSELERNGLLRGERAVGRYVTEDETILKKEMETITRDMIGTFLKEMFNLGFTKEEIINAIKETEVK
ncbi:MAG: GntR family transcriptional regulator [Coprobacillaceae bacterium]